MSAVAEKLLTAEEYARLAANIDGSTELVRGRMAAMNPPHTAHGYWAGHMRHLLNTSLKQHQF